MIDEKRLDEIRANAVEGKGKGYYGLPLLKKPVWTWEVPAYFFVGGTAGAAAVIALAAQLARADRKLVRDARWIAAGGAVLSAPLLIADLGRPERFLYMLRIFKPQSAMSVGSWTLTVFGGASATAALLEESVIGNLAALVSAAAGTVMATYTGVLLGVTAIPLWAKNASHLPMNFAASAAASAASALQLAGHDDSALQILGAMAAAAETYMARSAKEPMIQIAAALSGPVPLLLRLLGMRSKRAQRIAAASALAGAVMTRFAWIHEGRKSADKYHPHK